jgi:hypothetical protein
MSMADTTTEAFANTRPSSADALRDYAPIPRACALVLIDYQEEVFEASRPETPADSVERVRLPARTAKAFAGMRPI